MHPISPTGLFFVFLLFFIVIGYLGFSFYNFPNKYKNYEENKKKLQICGLIIMLADIVMLGFAIIKLANAP